MCFPRHLFSGTKMYGTELDKALQEAKATNYKEEEVCGCKRGLGKNNKTWVLVLQGLLAVEK